MIIILFRGREIIAPAGSGRRDSCRGIRNPNLPSAAHPAWMGSRNLRRIISLLQYSGGMELADEVLLGHALPAGRLQRDFPPSCNSSRQGGLCNQVATRIEYLCHL